MRSRRIRVVGLAVIAALAVGLSRAPAFAQEEFEWRDGNWVMVAAPAKGTPAGEAALVRQQLEKGNPRAACSDADKFLKAYPLDPAAEEVLMYAGKAEMARGRYYQAYEYFERQVTDFPSGRYFERSLQLESDCAEKFLTGTKRIVWGIFYLPAKDDGLAILAKIVAHAPGSALAEKSLLRIADYHYQEREYPEAIKAYDQYLEVFARNEKASYAMLQAARASLASYRGPEFDDRPLLEARQRYTMFAQRFPLQADRANVPQIQEQIRLSLAHKTFTTAQFYERVGRRDPAKYYYRLVMAQYPQTEWETKAATALLRLGEANGPAYGDARLDASDRAVRRDPAGPRVRAGQRAPAFAPAPRGQVTALAKGLRSRAIYVRVIAETMIEARTPRSPFWRSAAACLVLAGALLALGGCGYSIDAPYRMQYKTVHVPMWTRGKDIYRRELEFRVTEAVQKRIEGYSPYRIEKKGKADTELTGSIDQISQRPLSINSNTGFVNELEVTFIVSFKWVDLSSGEILVERSNFKVSGTYFPANPVSEDFYQGSSDVIDRLATRVVEQMEKPFTKPAPPPPPKD